MNPQLKGLPDNIIQEEYQRRFQRLRGERLQSANAADSHGRAFLATLPKDQEHFCVIYMDAQNQIIQTELVSSGGLSQAAVFPRNIVKRLLELESGAIICFHNHPSGEVSPSNSDRALTKKLASALSVIDCQLLDHLVIGDGFYSFSDQGLL